MSTYAVSADAANYGIWDADSPQHACRDAGYDSEAEMERTLGEESALETTEITITLTPVDRVADAPIDSIRIIDNSRWREGPYRVFWTKDTDDSGDAVDVYTEWDKDSYDLTVIEPGEYDE